MRALRSLLAIILVLTGGSGAASARPLDDVVASKVLRVILYEDNEPFSWNDKGELRGIDVEIARAVAAKLGVQAEITLRMTGEQIDQDLRTNVVRGTFGGGIAGDVMFHVPVDREVGLRVREAVIGNAYFQQRIGLAVRSDRAGEIASFDVFKSEKIGVQLATVSDYFLMRFAGGALVNNISHYLKPKQGVDRFVSKETPAVLGVRSHMEAMLKERGVTAKWQSPPMPGITRAEWVLGTAVNEQSRDLSYAIGAALSELAADGTLAAICGKFGVTYLPPPVN
ncbi:MAG: transporter substrate-binding domain-containing protein [Hyphomicrobiaceae bacterium]